MLPAQSPPLSPPASLAAQPGTASDGADRRRADRRRHSVGSFVYGGFRPRRRVGRRAGDDANVFLDWHEPRVLYLVLAVLLLSCADAWLTLNILAGGGAELNGLMDWLIAADASWFVLVKTGITGFGLTLLAVLARRHFLGRLPVMTVLHVFLAGYLALIGYELYLLGQIYPSSGAAAVIATGLGFY